MPPFAIKREQFRDMQVGNDINQRQDFFFERFLKEQMRNERLKCEDPEVLQRSQRKASGDCGAGHCTLYRSFRWPQKLTLDWPCYCLILSSKAPIPFHIQECLQDLH